MSFNAQSFFAVAAQNVKLAELPRKLYQCSFSLEGARWAVTEQPFIAGPKDGRIEAVQEWVEKRENLVGKYAKEHGALSFCNEDGEIFVTALSPDAESVLHKAKYQQIDSERFYGYSLHAHYANDHRIETAQGIDVLEQLFNAERRVEYKISGEEQGNRGADLTRDLS